MTIEHTDRPKRLCIALPSTPRNLYEEIGRMLLDSLADYGFEATIVEDGDKTGLYADFLIMMGDCQAFQRYPGLLKAQQGKRPTTLLWLLDTLPPTSLSMRAAKIGSRLALYNQGLLFMRSQFRPVVSMIPLGLRKKLGVKACSTLMMGLEKELKNSSDDQLRKLDTSSMYEVVGRYEWIRNAVSEGWLDQIFVNTVPKEAFLAGMGIESTFVPLGYHTDMGVDQKLERDIDVLFLGELDYGRRKPIVEYVQSALEKQGIKLTIVSGSCYGEQRAELMSRAKVSLNIPRFTWDIPTIRIFMSMGCGSMVISEEIDNPSPFKSGKHLVQAPVMDLPNTIAEYVKDDAKRRTVVNSANGLINGELSLKRVLGQVLKLACEKAANCETERTAV